jgi:hypothetical protein
MQIFSFGIKKSGNRYLFWQRMGKTGIYFGRKKDKIGICFGKYFISLP